MQLPCKQRLQSLQLLSEPEMPRTMFLYGPIMPQTKLLHGPEMLSLVTRTNEKVFGTFAFTTIYFCLCICLCV